VLGAGAPALHAQALPSGDPQWEGAVGLVAHRGASFPGSSDFGTSLRPGGFIRWGRYTLTGAGGFTTRAADRRRARLRRRGAAPRRACA
jgi:hypothetical protein